MNLWTEALRPFELTSANVAFHRGTKYDRLAVQDFSEARKHIPLLPNDLKEF
jgi:hypothetical protein